MFRVELQRAPDWHTAAIIGDPKETVAEATLFAREHITGERHDDLRVGIVNIDTKETVCTH